MRIYRLLPLPALFCALSVAHAAGPDAASPDTTSPNSGDLHMDIDIIAQRLDLARQQIQPALGATSYNFSPEALQNLPQAENAPLNQETEICPSDVNVPNSSGHLPWSR